MARRALPRAPRPSAGAGADDRPIRSDGSAEPTPPRRPRERPSLSAIIATGLVISGAFLFTAGAVLAAWPVWAAGLALFAGGFVLYRP